MNSKATKKTLLILTFLVLITTAFSAAQALDSIALELGTAESDEDVNRFGVAFKWDWNVRWLTIGDWSLGGYWEVGANYWDGDEGRTGNDSLGDFHLTPVLRYQH
ncbi:MAG: acyloxyacyl hydrolase, partial [Gammaproteobacteria bacterium]